MEGVPKFIKGYSKEHNQVERDALAKEIRELRVEMSTSTADDETYRIVDEMQVGSESVEVMENITVLSQIKSWLHGAGEYLPAQIQSLLSQVKKQEGSPDANEEASDLNAGSLSTNWREEAVRALRSFYDKQTEQWKEASYESAEVEKYFDSTFLSTLSLEDYTLLLTRFPSQMVTHVTRQGVRDHTGGVFHFAGTGEYWDGFKQILESGELKNFMSLYVTEDAKREGVAKLLKFDELTKEEAIDRLNDMCDIPNQRYDGSLSDRTSVHFAAEEVANAHYGAERGNEIFLAYPSLFIASQYHFSGQLAEAAGGTHNNQMVFTNDEEGVPISAGITFIPRNALVNPVTGSRYELDQENQPIKNEGLVTQAQELVSRPGFKDFASRYSELLGNSQEDSLSWISAKENLAQELKDVFGVTEPSLIEIVSDYDFLFGVKSKHFPLDNKFVYSCLSQKGLYYRPTSQTVTSEAYWTNYFTQNKDKQPNKVVYYEGEDPTQALRDWRINNGLFKRDVRGDLGFPQNNVDLTTDNQLTGEVMRFKSLALSIIEEYYS